MGEIMANSSMTVKDNSAQVLSQINRNITAALTAISLAVIEIASDYIMKRYYQPAYKSGTLLRSLTFELDPVNKKVVIGTNVEYAPWVHNGTHRMPARPFLKDAVLNNIPVYNKIAVKYLGAGWGVKANV